MNFGFPPRATRTFRLYKHTPVQYLALARKTMRQMGWDVEQVSSDELLAYTLPGHDEQFEKVTLRITDGSVYLRSQSSGRQWVDGGENERNLQHFLLELGEVSFATSESELISLCYHWSQFEPSEPSDDELPATFSPSIGTFTSLLTPGTGRVVTPILVYIHLLIFTAMVISGVHAFTPSGESLLAWGANYKISTLNGEFWRLFTSMWIHSSLLPLLVNMFALLYIGSILEPILGRVVLLLVYLTAGICGSTMSLWWHELSISAGAAGAVFGLYGVFVALWLMGNLLLRESPLTFLISTALFLLYNLASDVRDGIDNAAHVGGLLSGFLFGFMLYPTFHSPGYENIRRANLVFITLAFALVLYISYRRVPDAVARYEGIIRQCTQNDSLATEAYRNPQQLGKYQWRRLLQEQGIRKLDENLKRLDQLENLPEPLASQASAWRQYYTLRRHLFRMRVNSINQKTDRYEEAIENTHREIEGLLREMKGTTSKNIYTTQNTRGRVFPASGIILIRTELT